MSEFATLFTKNIFKQFTKKLSDEKMFFFQPIVLDEVIHWTLSVYGILFMVRNLIN